MKKQAYNFWNTWQGAYHKAIVEGNRQSETPFLIRDSSAKPILKLTPEGKLLDEDGQELTLDEAIELLEKSSEIYGVSTMLGALRFLRRLRSGEQA